MRLLSTWRAAVSFADELLRALSPHLSSRRPPASLHTPSVQNALSSASLLALVMALVAPQRPVSRGVEETSRLPPSARRASYLACEDSRRLAMMPAPGHERLRVRQA